MFQILENSCKVEADNVKVCSRAKEFDLCPCMDANEPHFFTLKWRQEQHGVVLGRRYTNGLQVKHSVQIRLLSRRLFNPYNSTHPSAKRALNTMYLYHVPVNK
jgi:hypothetical protein